MFVGSLHVVGSRLALGLTLGLSSLCASLAGAQATGARDETANSTVPAPTAAQGQALLLARGRPSFIAPVVAGGRQDDDGQALATLFEPSSPYAAASGKGWYFSVRQPATLYVTSVFGSRLERFDTRTRTLETVFDVGPQFGAGHGLQQAYSSDDDNVHSATLVDSGSGAGLGCLTYREDAVRLDYYPARGNFEECRVDGTGRWLSIRDVDLVAGRDNRLVDLETGSETPLFDRPGEAGPAAAPEASRPTSQRVAAAQVATDAFAPDPTLLPVATTAQVPLTAAYNLLQVPSKAAGSFYQDPSTGARIYKLTSATFPAPSPSWGHDYAEGGDEVSLPYDGNTRSALVRQNGGSWWLVDFAPGVGVGNARQLTGSLSPVMDLAFTFSNNPATPYYAYVSNGPTIRRFDIRSMTEAPGNGWPVTGEATAMWLHQSENDGLFVWMRGANGSTIVGYEPSTGTRKTYTNANLNEPRIDRAGRYVALSMNSPYNGLVVWDWQTNSVLWTTPGDPGIPFAHNASLRRRWMTVDWNMSYPPDYALFSADVPGSAVHVGGPANGTAVHGNGSWIQHPADLDDQWALFCHYGSLRPPESYWLAPGAMVLVTPNGQRRILGHPYNTTSNYTFFTFAKLSSDGKYVLFTSDMNGAGRSDVFLAELPQAATNPDATPPAISIDAPAAGGTVSGGALVVSANATDDVGVVGVQFKLDGGNLGAEVPAAPFAVVWNTTLTPNGSHTLTAVARDAAGNATVSAAVTVTVSNLVGPPIITLVGTSSVSVSGAVVTWTTDRPSDTQVEYGPTSAYGSSTALNTNQVVAHSQALAGLMPATLYHYRVKSRDAAGSAAVSGDFTFTTLSTLGQGLIAYLKLDEGSGSVAADSSGMGHPGNLVNGATWAMAHSGYGARLDGVKSVVRVPHAASLDAFPMSVALWFNTSTTTGVRGLLNKYVGGSYNGYQLFFNNGNLCAWYLRDTSNFVYDGGGCTFSTAGYNDGQWHQAVFVVDAAGGRLYVDGVQRGSRAWTGIAGAATTTQALSLGYYPGGASRLAYLPATIDDVRLYGRALSASEVVQLYGAQP